MHSLPRGAGPASSPALPLLAGLIVNSYLTGKDPEGLNTELPQSPWPWPLSSLTESQGMGLTKSDQDLSQMGAQARSVCKEKHPFPRDSTQT